MQAPAGRDQEALTTHSPDPSKSTATFLLDPFIQIRLL